MNKDFISIEKLLDEKLEHDEKKRLRKVLSYITEVVRGKKIFMIKGVYYIPEEIDQRIFPENINYILDEIIIKIREFST